MWVALELEGGVALAFPTPILKLQTTIDPELNATIAEHVLLMERRDKGTQRSNVGGWHSSGNIFGEPIPGAQELAREIEQALVALERMRLGLAADAQVRIKFGLEGWANVCRRGAYHKPHSHPQSTWSGVYYVEPGESDAATPESGVFEALDPRLGADLSGATTPYFGAAFKIRPEAGRMLLFPGWLTHFVNPYLGESPRISIAFNTRNVESETHAKKDGGLPRSLRTVS